MALPVMVIPYMMIHLPKLWPEATGAIVFGLFLGFLALRSRSIWGGVAIHASVALTLDLSGMIQTQGWPSVWWPVV
jgi:membrane protease YdiL (CAAX protease family)